MLKVHSLCLPYFLQDMVSIFLLDGRRIRVPLSHFQDVSSEGGRFHQFYTYLIGGDEMFSKETKRWLRALGIAKILFEDQGYHCFYLEDIENFIWRKSMYSPKIREDLIPKIYQMAKARGIKMTSLVNEILEKVLNGGDGLEAKEALSNSKEPDLSKEDGEKTK